MSGQVDRIIRMTTVIARTGLSRTTIYRKMREGTFPSNMQISIHGTGWHESAVNRWVANPPAYRASNDTDDQHEADDHGER